MKIYHWTMFSDSCGRDLAPDSVGRGPRRRSPRWLTGLGAVLLAAPALADQQRDPELRAVVQEAINSAQCFTDPFDSQVWFKMMEPRLRKKVPKPKERVEILQAVFCEAHRAGKPRLPPGLLLAIIDVESGFSRYAVSGAGAVGLMQVMPFWPEQLGMRRYQLISVDDNIKMGTAIFRYYVEREKNHVGRALARYNGSFGRRTYPDLVINRWTHWNGADDLGRTGNEPKFTW
jgi:soluble lytic murein transglycosylase-like protein